METTEQQFSGGTFYPPKPIVNESSGNNVTRSVISLFIYALLFYIIFDHNIVYIAALLVVLLIHEFGHFAMMKIYKYTNVKLFILPLIGAFVSGKKHDVSQKQMIHIILAGPIPGLIIGFTLYFLNRELQNDNLKLLVNTFIFLNLFNLLPIYPLDGGRFLETMFIQNNHGIRMVFTIISLVILTLLILFSQSFFMLVIPILMGLELFNESKNQKIRDYLDQEKIGYRYDYNNLPDKNYWLIRDCLIFSFPKKYADIPPGKYEYAMTESMLVQHVGSVLKTNFVSDLSVIQKVIYMIVYGFFLVGLPLVVALMTYL